MEVASGVYLLNFRFLLFLFSFRTRSCALMFRTVHSCTTRNIQLQRPSRQPYGSGYFTLT